ncbi:UDP-3-O-acyl-N-acetylglucosamine deacetylase [Desulfurispira natronophila]|uniref:UDP-3-O-acyl-N-acetylglucosamine deacetylase n=1 Tax=Desulfurispira natronophila TaxID=682562 RepID=A0A7W7Y484_9BACT|nr:UDP-3-O-acyl-N-acetylglucosamine deacetylase [Desulfurispira natronophila]MBB5021793.1 UDP-3-O-[3-hydroxymyristoyl] N-acetylglucosamine deacetylase [Desulfurispira natronophila]
MTAMQQTLFSPVSVYGVGLHSGSQVRIHIYPERQNAGIYFVRTDVAPPVVIPASCEYVVATKLATTLGRGEHQVSTVEHLMAAFYAMGIDNARVEIDGPEVPVLDGSSASFTMLMKDAGIVKQDAPRRELIITRPISIVDGDRFIKMLPASGYEIDFTIEFDHKLLSSQQATYAIDQETFEREISRSRTFAFKRDVDYLRSIGLAKGGSLENAVVIDDYKVMNVHGLRYKDEFVRHKILDCVGDLALCGARIRGKVVASKSGHELNNRLCRTMVAQEMGADACRVGLAAISLP